MPKKLVLPAVAVVLVVALAWYLRSDRSPERYTGVVEGEERVIRSEVSGRVLEVPFGEGAAVPANAVVARLDDRDVQTRLEAMRRQLGVTEADIRTQEERIRLVEATWGHDQSAQRAALAQAESTLELAERTLQREKGLVATGASTAQLLDDRRSARDQARSARDRARELLGKTTAEERSITLARRQLETLEETRELTRAQLANLEVTAAKYAVPAPAVPTVVQTQLLWPGELAQPGTPIVSVLDPADKYVQVYVPVAELDRFRVGRRVSIELDSAPGRRVAGEVSFVADTANFTPEKIETRDDRMGQVYRAKVRILEEAERLKPGTEGNVYLDGATG